LTFSYQIFCKNIVFLVSNGENVILPLLAPPEKHIWPIPGKSTSGHFLQKYFWPTPGKPTIGPPWKNILPAPMVRGTCSSIEMLKGYMARESLGTPALEGLNSSLAHPAGELWMNKPGQIAVVKGLKHYY